MRAFAPVLLLPGCGGCQRGSSPGRSSGASTPEGRVLSRDTGHNRPYGDNPYLGYDDLASSPLFPTQNSDDDRLAPKERVVFIERGGDAVVIPYSTLERRPTLEVVGGGERLRVRWRPGVASALDSSEIAEGRSVGAAEVRAKGRLVPFEEPFSFAVAVFRPDVRIVRYSPRPHRSSSSRTCIRARWMRLFAAATESSSTSATSWLERPTRSRSTSGAR